MCKMTVLTKFGAATVLCLTVATCPGSEEPIRDIGRLQPATKSAANEGRPFDLSGIVTGYYPDLVGSWIYTLSDGTDSCFVAEPPLAERKKDNPRRFGLLDRIRVTGRLTPVENELRAVFTASDRLSQGDLKKAVPRVTSVDFATTNIIGHVVRFCGRVQDVIRDGTDASFLVLSLHDTGGLVHAMVIDPPQFPSEHDFLLGAEVDVIGACIAGSEGLHRYFGSHLWISGLENVTVRSAAATFADAPDLSALYGAHPKRLASAGFHQATGTVLASWGGDSVLVRTAEGYPVRALLKSGLPPQAGNRVRLLGLPVTDSFHLNLTHASWRPADATSEKPDEAPINATVSDLTTNQNGYPQLMLNYYGKTVRLEGLVRYLPNGQQSGEPLRMQIESEGKLVTIDASSSPRALAQLEIGCFVSATGICIMDGKYPGIDSHARSGTDFFLVPRTAEDIKVLTRPPWWTPERLLALLGILAAALLGVIGWNVSLNRRARAKGKELAAEQLAHVTSELKVNERTRLAVELHDALSQTLTGVSMQIDTAAGFAEGKMPTISRCLAIASRTIDACRMELRNTLWDLRGAALDEPSMDSAIRKTLCQNLAGIDLSVRFNVPRETFSDNTAHAILKIIRELATNALRHGKATALRIAGTIDDGRLLFSVRDNGCGFDPDLAPGISQGHFGLQGIAERLERLNGEMKIESTRGKGTKATVILPIPHT